METKPVVQSSESFLHQDEMMTIVLNCLKRQYVACKAYDQSQVFLDMIKIAKAPGLYSFCHTEAIAALTDHVFTNDAIRDLVLNLTDSIKFALCADGKFDEYQKLIHRVSLTGIDSIVVSGNNREAEDYQAMPDKLMEVLGTTAVQRVSTFKYNNWLVTLFVINYLEVPLFSFIAEIK